MAMRSAVLMSLVAAGGAQQQCAGRTQVQCSGDCRWVNNGCSQICFRSNVAYTGDMAGTPITNEINQDACKVVCQNTAGCAHFTFYANSGDCHLQDNTASRTAESGAVSGEPECVEPTTSSTGDSSTGAGSSTGTGSSAGAGDQSTFVSPGSGSTSGGGSLAGGGSSATVQLPFSTGTGADSGSGLLGAGASGAADPFAAGMESMPSNVGSAMVVGNAQAQGTFSGLSAVFSFKWAPSAAGLWRVGTVTSGVVFLTALAYGSRRSRREGGHAAQRAALTSTEADVAE